ncbi:hypothetical protein F4819DRAFT_464966 [Hypoxylon fuscum]|nr:hypothetical protein F4819DRAFT_464966 [Hypoxylon fuscum]
MAAVAQLYNTLPTLGDADEKFVNREGVFKVVATLLAEYGHVFGLCLVHAHCKLAEGEIMIEKNNISQPEELENAGAYYPDRWLASGEPYEFTVCQTQAPPKTLVDQFHQLTKEAKLEDVLGLYYVDGPIEDPAIIEWTDGRKNLTRTMKEEDKAADPVQTAWNFARGDPVTMACTKWCDTRTTRSGENNVHKGTQSHG